MFTLKRLKIAFIVFILSANLISPSAAIGQQRKKAPGKDGGSERDLTIDQQDALGLLRYLISDLKSEPDTLAAARLQAQAADALWKFDEQGARATFRLAFETARQPIAESFSTTERTGAEKKELLSRQAVVLQEVLRRFGAHDQKSADTWLKQLEAEPSAEDQLSASLSPQRLELLAQLALQLVTSDPSKALQLGILSLSGNEMPEPFGRLLFALNNRDRSLSDTLFREGIAAMRRNRFKYSSALFSLANYIFDQRGKIAPGTRASDAQLLISYFFDAASAQLTLRQEAVQTEAAPSEQSALLYNFLVSYGTPIIEMNAAGKQEQFSTLLNELGSSLNQQQRQQVEQIASERRRQPSIQSGGDDSDLDSYLRQAEKETNPELRDFMLRRAAISLMRGESERALAVAAKIDDPILRAQTEDDINLTALSAKLREDHDDESRQTALKLNDDGLKAKVLTELAGAALSKSKDTQRALELLTEAYNFSLKSENLLSKLEALLAITEQFSKFDSARGFEVLSDAVKTINQLKTANPGLKSNLTRKPALRIVAITALNGKELNAGESPTLDSINFNRLGALIKKDYTRAKAIVFLVDNKLMRTKLLITVISSVLGASRQ